MSEWVVNTRIGKVEARTKPLLEAIEKVYESAEKLEQHYAEKVERTRKRVSKEKRNLG